jgi:deoxyribodipyrimidine photo-lyase
MVNIFWFRRDLRLEDNTGLYFALKAGLPVLPVFIFDQNILNKLDDKNDPRVTFIYDQIQLLKLELEKAGSSLLVKYGYPAEIFRQLSEHYALSKVFTNHDYEPYARERDKEIAGILKEKGTGFMTFKDQVIFEKGEVVKDSGEPYTVFTPYSKRWKSRMHENGLEKFSSESLLGNFIKTDPFTFPDLQFTGFTRNFREVPGKAISKEKINNYHMTRNFPALNGTSGLSIHLRFGTISIRNLVNIAVQTNEIYLNELIWREFYMMIIWHFPHVVSRSFKAQYDKIEWENDEKKFAAWCEGKTGYPFVDAGMRELNQTGFMHNRARMITASFLTKQLLIDWRWGEAYFGKKLMDYELSSNNGGWQWAAGTGCDAAPYFRIFNPDLQAKKFDPQLSYIRKWVPEFQSDYYSRKIVEHSISRITALSVYKKALY